MSKVFNIILNELPGAVLRKKNKMGQVQLLGQLGTELTKLSCRKSHLMTKAMFGILKRLSIPLSRIDYNTQKII